MGFRFRLHAKDLPGKPDLVFRSRKKAIFVHGCFWHQHPRRTCADGRAPKSNLGYWAAKLARTVSRDLRNREALEAMGWGVLVIWECETGDGGRLRTAISRFLRPQPRQPRA
jgi:DNA mismatch endonuclease, patch repair protein